MTIVRFDGFFMKKLGFFAFAVFALFSPLHKADAGILSFVEGLFKSVAVAEETINKNSQTAIVLEAVLNSSLGSSQNETDIAMVGGSAIIPDTGPAGTLIEAEQSDEKKNGQISVYVVRKGDSLSEIADMFGVSVSTIIWANDIGPTRTIREGQTLVILPVSGLEYTVQKGDTVESIAKKYKADAERIMEYNDISGVLAVGDTVIIPGGTKEAPRPVQPISSGASLARASDGPSYAGYYLRPISGGRRSQGIHGHNAVDLAAPYGTPIMASASGTVIISRNTGWSGGYGKYIVVEHDNGTQTLYSHNSENIVEPGQKVIQGQVIGFVGSTGRSTGNHVHFEIRGARNPF